ncbi:hypothetical protein RFI_19737, partial [Reticulomyxa filosa]
KKKKKKKKKKKRGYNKFKKQLSQIENENKVVPIFSTVIFMNGMGGAFLGKWIDRVGPRIALGIGGLCYGGGIMLGSLGIAYHSLPLVYLGYVKLLSLYYHTEYVGIIGGLGHGICYISPISTIISWFPDKPGFAVGEFFLLFIFFYFILLFECNDND